MKRILLIIENAETRDHLKYILGSEGHSVQDARNGLDGVQFAARHNPDLIFLELDLPDNSSIQTLKHFRDWFRKPIIVLSLTGATESIIVSLENGANDYLVNPFHIDEIRASIERAIRTSSTVRNQARKEFADLTVDFLNRSVRKRNTKLNLTEAEYHLLCVFAQNESRVLTSDYIEKEVLRSLGSENIISIINSIRTLRNKVEDNPDRPTHIITEPGIGYRFVGSNV